MIPTPALFFYKVVGNTSRPEVKERKSNRHGALRILRATQFLYSSFSPSSLGAAFILIEEYPFQCQAESLQISFVIDTVTDGPDGNGDNNGKKNMQFDSIQ